MEKSASSKLRALAKVFRLGGMETPSWLLRLGKKNIGYIRTHAMPGGDYGIFDSYLHPKYRGMGLGKKMYGDAFRNLKPGKFLHSDAQLSAAASNTWDGLQRRADDLERWAEYGGGADSPWFINRARGVLPHKTPTGELTGGEILKPFSGKPGIFTVERSPYLKNLRGTPIPTLSPPAGRTPLGWQEGVLDDLYKAQAREAALAKARDTEKWMDIIDKW